MSTKEETVRYTGPIFATPLDSRFPNQNQGTHCWSRYNEWLVCLNRTGKDEDACKVPEMLAHSICPQQWLDTWADERDEGTFAGIQVKE